MKKVAGIILLVNRTEESVAFYRKLGFEVIKEVRDTATTLSLGEFWVELLHNNKVISEEYKEDTKNSAKGAGIYLQVQVDDTDVFYDAIVGKGIQPSRMPEDYPWKRREFIVVDPDGYKIAFFNSI